MFPMARMLSLTVAQAALAALIAAPAAARTWHVDEMNTEELGALDPAKTVVLLPGGILEEHGPYLPSNTDGFVSERMARDVAEAIVERGFEVLIFPPLVLGSGGANELASKHPYPGTYAVRLETLRAVYMDLADELGESGFRWIFVINSHGAPNHNRVLDEAGDYFGDTWGGRMLHVTGGNAIFTAKDNPRHALSEQAQKEDAWSGHAGIDETSLMLFLRPDLVSPEYRNAPVFTAAGPTGMMDVAKRDDWTGYFGAPGYASAEYGAKLYRIVSANMVKEALAALDAPKATRTKQQGMPLRDVDDAAIARDRAIAKRQREWLEKNVGR